MFCMCTFRMRFVANLKVREKSTCTWHIERVYRAGTHTHTSASMFVQFANSFDRNLNAFAASAT